MRGVPAFLRREPGPRPAPVLGALAFSPGTAERVAELGGERAARERLVAGVTAAAGDILASADAVAHGAVEAQASVRHVSSVIESVALTAKRQASAMQGAVATLDAVSLSAELIAEGAREQSQAVQSASTAVVQIDAELSLLAECGSDLSERAAGAKRQADEGGEAARRSVAALRSMQRATEDVAGAMTALVERANDVGALLDAIDEIADQTNLLALNAAIEAARAGAHGRGFAVVADEVRKLADGARQTTREIVRIFAAVRKEAESAKSALAVSGDVLGEGMARSTEAAGALEAVAGAIARTAGVASEVAARTVSMKQAAAVLADTMSSVETVAATNTAAAAEMHATTNDVLALVRPAEESAGAMAREAASVATGAAEIAAQAAASGAAADRLRALAHALHDAARG